MSLTPNNIINNKISNNCIISGSPTSISSSGYHIADNCIIDGSLTVSGGVNLSPENFAPLVGICSILVHKSICTKEEIMDAIDTATQCINSQDSDDPEQILIRVLSESLLKLDSNTLNKITK